MQRLMLTVGLLLLLSPCALACGLKYDAVSATQLVRPQGWMLPGIADFVVSARINTEGLPPTLNVPGLKAFVLAHEEPYVIELPEQEFLLKDSRQRMRSLRAKATIMRFEMDGKVFAYSYGLVPVTAHRSNGKWIVDSEAGCIFYVTFIDDRGDGVFRALTEDGLKPDMIPAWVKRPKGT